MAVRESNFELLRNLAMFMVLIIHANFVSLPTPMEPELTAAPIATIFRYLTESLGIVSVNIFILISGWFRINTNAKRVLKFVFQILCFWIGGYLVCLLLGGAVLSWEGILACFSLTKWDWFIKAYAVLLIIAPVLNAFVDQASDKQLRNFLIAFFLFQSTYGWIGGGSRFFVYGYGPLSFIRLYLLAQYARRETCKETPNPFRLPKYFDLLLFLVTAILNTAIALVYLKSGHCVNSYVFAYCNPLVILGSLFLLLFFSKLKMKPNRVINWFGASSFAVYLLHSQVDIRKYFTEIVVNLESRFQGVVAICMIFLFLILTFLVSVLLDQIRIWAWNKISNLLFKEHVQASH